MSFPPYPPEKRQGQPKDQSWPVPPPVYVDEDDGPEEGSQHRDPSAPPGDDEDLHQEIPNTPGDAEKGDFIGPGEKKEE